MVVSAFALFNFAFIFASSFVTISGGDSPSFYQVAPCPEGTHRFWLDNCIMFIEKNDTDKKMTNALLDRGDATELCKMQDTGIGIGYSWTLPELQFIGKQQVLYQIMYELDEQRNGTFKKPMGGWYFWNRLTRKLGDQEWKWNVGDNAVNASVEEATDFPWFVDETDDDAFLVDLQDENVCVISKETSNGTYPWFEWVEAPCEVDQGTSNKSVRLQATLKSNGIVVCEGTPGPSSIVIFKPTPCPEISTSANSKEQTTTSQTETTPTSIAKSDINSTTPKPSESTTPGSIETSPWAFVFMAVLFVSLFIIPILAFRIWLECIEVRKLESYLDHGSTATNAQMPTDSMIEDSTDDSYAQEMGRIPKPKPKPKGRKKKRHTK